MEGPVGSLGRKMYHRAAVAPSRPAAPSRRPRQRSEMGRSNAPAWCVAAGALDETLGGGAREAARHQAFDHLIAAVAGGDLLADGLDDAASRDRGTPWHAWPTAGM